MTELQALVRAAQDGDKDAFGQVVRRFQDMAYASAYATVGDACLAQDIAQEAFLDAYLNLSKLRDPAAFPGWLRRIIIGHSNRLPEEAFYFVGMIDQAVAKAKHM